MLDLIKTENWADMPVAKGELRSGAGIQPWSTDERYVIFSFSDIDEYIAAVNFIAENSIGYKKVYGRWNGSPGEHGVIINSRDWLAVKPLLSNVESVLYLAAWSKGGRPASLYYRNGVIEAIGTYRQQSEDYAFKHGSYTYDPSNNEYFVAS